MNEDQLGQDVLSKRHFVACSHSYQLFGAAPVPSEQVFALGISTRGKASSSVHKGGCSVHNDSSSVHKNASSGHNNGIEPASNAMKTNKTDIRRYEYRRRIVG